MDHDIIDLIYSENMFIVTRGVTVTIINNVQVRRSRICGALRIKLSLIFTKKSTIHYRMTHQVEPNLPLTAKQKFCFGLVRSGQARPGQAKTKLLF